MKTTPLFLFLFIFGISSIYADEEKPNILFNFADDWGWGDLSSHGHPYVKTPNIDRLVKEGTDFHRFSVASGVCSPSWAAVMTGQFPARYSIDGHFAWPKSNEKRNMPDWLDPKAPSLPRILQSGGYATAHFGKWHLSNNMIPDSPLPSVYGYDAYGAFNCAGEQMPVHDDAKNTIQFIEKCQVEGKPFFINLWIHEPHTPFHTVDKYRKRFPDLPESDNIYASILSHADDRIGEVLDTLDRLQLTDNTLVVFSSDNGPARSKSAVELKLMYDTATGEGYNIAAAKGITAGRKGHKATIYEGGIGVPFIARWPGKIAAGVVDDASLISAVDLLPTFCEVAGVPLPDGYKPDGLSQLAVLKGKKSPIREKTLFWRMPTKWTVKKKKPEFHWATYAVVDKQWKLLSNVDTNYSELYHIGKDPYEKNDLKDKNPEVVEKMLKKLEVWKSTLPAKADPTLSSAERKK